MAPLPTSQPRKLSLGMPYHTINPTRSIQSMHNIHSYSVIKYKNKRNYTFTSFMVWTPDPLSLRNQLLTRQLTSLGMNFTRLALRVQSFTAHPFRYPSLSAWSMIFTRHPPPRILQSCGSLNLMANSWRNSAICQHRPRIACPWTP